METIILIILAVYVLASMLFHLDGRVVIALALALLIITAITLALGNSDFANQFAIYAYFALVTGVTIIFIEYLSIVPESFSFRCRAYLISLLSTVISWLLIVLLQELARLNPQKTSNTATKLVKRLEKFTHENANVQGENHTSAPTATEELKKITDDKRIP